MGVVVIDILNPDVEEKKEKPPIQEQPKELPKNRRLRKQLVTINGEIVSE